MTAPAAERHDVVICGAGPVGLTLSILLSRAGVRHLVIDRREGVNPVPRARGIAHRTGEIWDLFGLTPELKKMSLSEQWVRQIVYQETLAGELIGAVPTPHSLPGAQAHLSTSDYYCISQDKTDALLERCAAAHPQATIRFRADLVAQQADADGVTLEIERPEGRTTLRAGWLVGCDGAASRVRQRAGIAHDVLKTMDSFVNAHFFADLGRWSAGREAALLWNMREGLEGVFGPLDGDRFWRCQIGFDPAKDPPESWTPEKVLARIRAMIGAPESETPDLALHSFYPYVVMAAVASHFVKGRVLLAGDSAHQIPPHGAQGMNAGVQSAHNLAWKLAAVLRGQAPAALLRTYDTERREVAERVIRHAIANYDRVKRIRQTATPQERREAVKRARGYGNAMGLDLGVHYEIAGAFVPDDAPPPALADPVADFVPCAKPGYRAPLLWLRRGSQRLSTLALCDGGFTVLAGRSGGAWCEAARVSNERIPLAAYRVAADGDLVPEDADFEALYGIGADGAVLIRPDGHVAWRGATASRDPRGVLSAALDRILCRS